MLGLADGNLRDPRVACKLREGGRCLVTRVISTGAVLLPVMTKNLAYCGLDCTECPAYIAMKTNARELRRTTAEKWNNPDFPVLQEDINCVGCKTEEGAHFKWCAKCSVRACASERNMETCAHCSDYVCDPLKEWLTFAGDEARERLEKIRAAL